MNLENLNPQYLRYELKPFGVIIDGFKTEHGTPFEMGVSGNKEIITSVQTLEEANGISFDCPYCMKPHRVTCWFTTVPIFASPSRYRWNAIGPSEKPTITIAVQNEFVIDRQNDCVWSKSIISGVIS